MELVDVKRKGILFSSPDVALNEFINGSAKLCVIGLGRIGLPTAAMFASSGFKVIGADVNPIVVTAVNDGECQFFDEPGLDKLLGKAVKEKNLEATTDISGSVSKADLILICVPTPVDSTKTPDYSYVMKSSETVGISMKPRSIVVLESTVGPGTVEELIQPILEKESGLKAGIDFGLASCPERSDPGNIVSNMSSVPRVIGAVNKNCEDIVALLYEHALGVKVFKASNPKTANAIKLTENLFRDVNIALANEFALLYEKLGIDVIEVIKGCSTKYNFMPHYPGAGVGGPCLPVNSYYLMVEGMKYGNIPYIIRLAREINDRMPHHMVDLVQESMNEVGRTVKGMRLEGQ